MVAHEGALQDVIEKHQEQEGEGTTSGKPTPGSGKKRARAKARNCNWERAKKQKNPVILNFFFSGTQNLRYVM